MSKFFKKNCALLGVREMSMFAVGAAWPIGFLTVIGCMLTRTF
jgi:hypothetical protein